MMRVAVASDDGVVIAAHTGRCGGFAIFDVEGGHTRRVEYRINAFTAHAQGACTHNHAALADGQHSHAALVAALQDCTVLLTRGLGPRLVADLTARGIATFVCAAERVDEAVQQYAQGRLAPATASCCCHHC